MPWSRCKTHTVCSSCAFADMNTEACNVHMLAFKLAEFRFSINVVKTHFRNCTKFLQLHTLPQFISPSAPCTTLHLWLLSERKVFMHFRFLALFNFTQNAHGWCSTEADYSYLINASRCNPIVLIHRVDVQRSSDHFQLRLKQKAQFKQFNVFLSFLCFENRAKSNHFRLSWIPPDDWWVEQRKKSWCFWWNGIMCICDADLKGEKHLLVRIKIERDEDDSWHAHGGAFASTDWKVFGLSCERCNVDLTPTLDKVSF